MGRKESSARDWWSSLHWAARWFLGLAVFSILGSLASRFVAEPPVVGMVVSMAMIGCGVVVAGRPIVRSGRGGWFALVGALVIGAVGEIVGLATGAVFGRYEYTERWAPIVQLPQGPFPVQLPFAWLMMAGCAHVLMKGIVESRGGSRWAAVPLAGLLAAVANVPMEPVMAGPLGYWRWLDGGPMPGGAPVQNFIGWFGTTVVASALMAAVDRSEPVRGPSCPFGFRECNAVLSGFVLFVALMGLVRG